MNHVWKAELMDIHWRAFSPHDLLGSAGSEAGMTERIRAAAWIGGEYRTVLAKLTS